MPWWWCKVDMWWRKLVVGPTKCSRLWNRQPVNTGVASCCIEIERERKRKACYVIPTSLRRLIFLIPNYRLVIFSCSGREGKIACDAARVDVAGFSWSVGERLIPLFTFVSFD